jgi:hypothetical protein
MRVHPQWREVLHGALNHLNQADIARALHMDRKSVRRVLHWLVQQRLLTLAQGGGRGRAERYEPGPLQVPESTELASPSADMGVHRAPPEILPQPLEPRDLSRVHHIGYKLPLFEDELWYRDPATGVHSDRRWTIASWEGDILKRWETKGGTKHYVFREERGGWRLILWAKPRRQRAVGHKHRVAWRTRVGTVWLTPNPLRADTEQLKRAEEMEFAAVMDLVKDIRINRGLYLEGIPEPRNLTEYGEGLDEDETIPAGRTELRGGLGQTWIDHSVLPGARPELETNHKDQAVRNRLALQQLRQVPDLADRLDRWETEMRAMRRELEDLLNLVQDLARRTR